MQLKIEYLKINDLKPYERNTRKHEEHDVDQIAKSIEKYGFSDPIGVWGKQNIIVEGHGRLLAAKQLGMESVPVIHLDHLSDAERREYAIMHNRTAELSSWDFQLLSQELDDLDLGAFDFDGLDINTNDFDVNELEEVDAPEPPEEPKSKRGQIYQLGNHRLMCGDSTSSEDVSRLMDGAEADIIITDPPYNVAINQGAESLEEKKILHKRRDDLKIENDQWDSEEGFMEFLTDALGNGKEHLKAGGVFYIWYGSTQAKAFLAALEALGLQLREELVWVKHIFSFTRQDYQWRHEACLYGWKEGAAHYFINSRTETTVIENLQSIEPEKMKKEELVELVKKMLSETATTVIHEDKPTASKLHPTMKPINLIGYQLRNSSKIGECVLDLFGGSGTTLMAAEQTKRKCYMMEYDPHYADVIIQRWEEYTGRKAVLISEKEGGN